VINYKQNIEPYSKLSKRVLYYLAANVLALGALTSISLAGEPPSTSRPKNGVIGSSQSQDQYQNQNQEQFQDQNHLPIQLKQLGQLNVEDVVFA